MEVLSIFSTSETVVKSFDNFLSNHKSLELNTECEDTKYFINLNTGRYEIYFHFLFNSIEEEFLSDYSIEERKTIIDFFKNNKFYFFDIQYRNELFLKRLMLEFINYLDNINEFESQKVLLSHITKGIILLKDF